MGTRNITFVKFENETKIAQYCQWDGYPTGRGADVLTLMRDVLASGKLDEMKRKLHLSKLTVRTEDSRGNATYTGAPITKTREDLFKKVEDYRTAIRDENPEAGYMNWYETVTQMKSKELLTVREANYLIVASRDSGPDVLRYLMNDTKGGMKFWADQYSAEMDISGDWQIEGVYVIDLDNDTITIAYHGRSESFDLGVVRNMSDAYIERAMTDFEESDN